MYLIIDAILKSLTNNKLPDSRRVIYLVYRISGQNSSVFGIVRIISATNKDLKMCFQKVRVNRF